MPANFTASEIGGLTVRTNFNDNGVRVNVTDAMGCTFSASGAPQHVLRNTIVGCTHSRDSCYNFFANKHTKGECCDYGA